MQCPMVDWNPQSWGYESNELALNTIRAVIWWAFQMVDETFLAYTVLRLIKNVIKHYHSSSDNLFLIESTMETASVLWVFLL